MLNKKNRIGDRKLIEDLFKKGDTYKDSFFIFKYKKIDTFPAKFALSVSKKILKSAVKRNHLRRQIYEAIRLHLPESGQSLMAFVIARSTLTDPSTSFQQIEASIQSFFNRL